MLSLDLDAEYHTGSTSCAADSCSGIDFCAAAQFSQLLSTPISSATAFAVHISHVEASNSFSLIHIGTFHPSLSSWLSS